MDANQLRRSFIEYFEKNGHTVRPSASLIPTDPTLLLNNAGMVPFKPYFLGEEPAPWDRAVSVQKCVRTIDIDIIGTTARHLSFFEMMGNFSFGDYFKSEAIRFAHDYVTNVVGLDEDRLWYTVHETDDDARQIWIDQEGISPDRVQLGGEDNFWQMGVPGPCGPSSEIFYDRGPQYGEDGGAIGGGEDRFVEIWNLVFMQNIQDKPYNVIGDLPSKSIDTGLGLERMAMVLQGADSAFGIDSMRHVIEAGSRYTGVNLGASPESDVSLRILGDHARSVTMLVSDGVRPANTGRGYVLRRLLRRAVRHAWQMGGQGLVMPQMTEAAVESLVDGYPELQETKSKILDVVTREEDQFRQTLSNGQTLLSTAIDDATDGVLSGSVAFKLHDTFGFPIDLTKEIALEAGLAVDENEFEQKMAEQQSMAKAAFKGGAAAELGQMYLGIMDGVGSTIFLGYEAEASSGRMLAIVTEGETIERADQDQRVEVFLDQTPFYAESGGQVGDTGTIVTPTGTIVVEDTQHAVQGFHGHRGVVSSGFVAVGQDAELSIDSPRREAVRKSHTGTHLLHANIRTVVGDHAHQAGSLVEAGRLRFDFNHFSALDPEELAEVERLTNTEIIANPDVATEETSMDEAKAKGALAFFGDKYGDRVRVVTIGDVSAELCGGTHTRTAGQVGPVMLLGESSIGSNVRRLEALTGVAAYEHIASMRASLEDAGSLLRSGPMDVPSRLAALIEKNRELESKLSAAASQGRDADAREMANAAIVIGDSGLVVAERSDLAPDELRQLALSVKQHLASSVVILGSAAGGKGALIASVSNDLVSNGLSAAELITEAARMLGGGGSRDPELAQAGGPDGTNIAQALDLARGAAENSLSEV